jgi:thymidylate synthase ThyX
MTITAKVIADSISPAQRRITTLELQYPRFFHSELMTHRVFSRNASSSRAIPINKALDKIQENMAKPIFWGKNQAGMQSFEELGADLKEVANIEWEMACADAVMHAKRLAQLGLHKQYVNRIVEPFAHITVIVTATEWENYFDLRDHKDAFPDFRALAQTMKKVMDESDPTEVEYHDWHLPYVLDLERSQLPLATLRKISAARCARVSYLTHDGRVPNVDEDLALYERLVGSHPMHASPVEHQAFADHPDPATGNWASPELHGNFVGWGQFRKIIEFSKSGEKP